MFKLLWFLVSFISFTKGETVCYEPFGCFSDEAPFDHYLMTNPKSPDDVKTTFTIHTPYRKRKFDAFNGKMIAQAARILNNRHLKIIIHGLLESSDKTWVRRMTKGLLDKQQTDVMVVDYEEGATGLMATGNARLVGAQLAYFLKHFLKIKQRDGKRVHIIGFSAGAHIAGYTGTRLKNNGYQIGRITGLDPGDLPHGFQVYENAHPLVRLDNSDADFVDVIHTDISGLGIDNPIGHLDFYPNGGSKQPGCDVVSSIQALGRVRSPENFFHVIGCNHIRAVYLFIESLSSSSCQFTAYPCNDLSAFEAGTCFVDCNGERCPVLGYDAVKVANASKFTGKKLFLHTEGKGPYCKITKEPLKRKENSFYSQVFAGLKSLFSW